MLTTHVSDHRFHFVLGSELRKNLERLPLFDKEEGVSRLIERIIERFVPMLEKDHQRAEQKMSEYKLVSPDLRESREHMYVELPEVVYRLLKIMHQDCDYYSIAQIIRGYLELFLEYAGLYGEGTFEVLHKMFCKWQEKDNKNRLTTDEYLAQLRVFLSYLPGRNRLLTLYKWDYSPFKIFRL